jgi:predicted DNA-binding transcriptional regulator AlpA
VIVSPLVVVTVFWAGIHVLVLARSGLGRQERRAGGYLLRRCWVAQPSQAQADLFFETSHKMPPPAKKHPPKAKSSCAKCLETYYTVQEVADRYKVDRSSVWRWVENEPYFPRPVKLTPGTTRWLLSDLVRFEQAQKASFNQKRPKGGAS